MLDKKKKIYTNQEKVNKNNNITIVSIKMFEINWISFLENNSSSLFSVRAIVVRTSQLVNKTSKFSCTFFQD